MNPPYFIFTVLISKHANCLELFHMPYVSFINKYFFFLIKEQ